MLRSGKQPFLRRKALRDDSGSGCVGDYQDSDKYLIYYCNPLAILIYK